MVNKRVIEHILYEPTYETGIHTIIKIANYFNLTLDDLVFKNLSEEQKNPISNN